jgi:hypothetical protein
MNIKELDELFHTEIEIKPLEKIEVSKKLYEKLVKAGYVYKNGKKIKEAQDE